MDEEALMNSTKRFRAGVLVHSVFSENVAEHKIAY